MNNETSTSEQPEPTPTTPEPTPEQHPGTDPRTKHTINELELHTSDSIGNLSGALAKAQGEFLEVGKDKQGYGYKYMTLSALFTSVRQALSKHSVAIIQSNYLVRGDKPSVMVETMLSHESGEWIKSKLEIPLNPMKQLTIAQMIGVASTYGRRYALQSMVGIAAEEDTDGK